MVQAGVSCVDLVKIHLDSQLFIEFWRLTMHPHLLHAMVYSNRSCRNAMLLALNDRKRLYLKPRKDVIVINIIIFVEVM